MCATRIAAATDRGPRDNLEDAFAASKLVLPLASDCKEIVACVVCDGVGGNRYGEIASELATDYINFHLTASFAFARPASDSALLAPDNILDAIKTSLICANEGVLERVGLHPELKGMSTTAVCAVIVNSVLYVGWAGDSSCCVCSNGGLRRITRDHSEVQRLIDADLLSEEEAKSHPLRHTINRFIGQPRDFAPEMGTCRLADGDIVLLCTDGLTDVLANTEILGHVQLFQDGRLSLDELPKRLIRHALDAGTTDNVTVLCCEYHTEPHTFGRTLTGAYPVAAAKAIQDFHKEAINA